MKSKKTNKNRSFHCIKAVLYPVLFIGLLMSCNPMHKVSYPDAKDFTTNLFREVNDTDSVSMASVSWKDLFTDVKLQSLITEAVQNNPDLKIAESRIHSAMASFKQSKAAFLPTLDASFEGSYNQTGSSDGVHYNDYTTYLGASWEADMWGKLKNAKKAALNSLYQSEAYKKAVQCELVTNVVTYYYTLLAYDEELLITQESYEKYKSDVVTLTKLMENSTATGADVAQSSANMLSSQAEIPLLKQSIRETENAICLLLGKPACQIERSTFSEQQINIDLKLGLPYLLLANRPDIQEAEYALRYYLDEVNVAKSYFYPSFTITAQGGFDSEELVDLFKPAAFFANLAGGLTSPLWNGRANRQRLEVAKANAEEYLETFHQTLLLAGNEVSDNLFAYQMLSESLDARKMQIEKLGDAVEYTKKLLVYSPSTTNYNDVLSAEQSLLSAQLSSVECRLDQLNSLVKLYASLGGGRF